jgi:valyl-tRNA synthetase
MVDPHSGEMFTPKYITDASGHMVAAPIQESPKDPKKKMVSSYGVASGKAKPTAEMPLARNTSSKFDLGRNFANKLWNAARFAMMNLGKAPPEPVDEAKWSLADRWIVSRFNRTVAEANDALADYRFDQYARACYDFFWRDFCDWYLEAIKPAMRDPKRAGQTANVLAAVLDGSLRLMHPMIPFITETIWWRLNDVRPQRGLPGRIEGKPSERLIIASWPTVGQFSEAAEHIFPKLQDLVGAIRNVRNEHQVDPKKPVTVSIRAGSEDSARQIRDNREIIELLGTCAIKDARTDLPEVAGAARVSASGCEIFVEGLVDQGAETQRLSKRRDELAKQISAMKGRLSNEGYIAKAPAHLVQQTKDQLAQAEAELAKLG